MIFLDELFFFLYTLHKNMSKNFLELKRDATAEINTWTIRSNAHFCKYYSPIYLQFDMIYVEIIMGSRVLRVRAYFNRTNWKNW